MKNIDHLAYHPNYNFPVHISSPDSVRDHLNDQIRLIAMMPGEWPRLRCRDLKRDNLVVEDEYVFTINNTEHRVEVVKLLGPDYRGKLVDGKYFFTFAALAATSDLELLFANFAKFNIAPAVQLDWSMEYPTTNLSRYNLEVVGEERSGVERFYPFHNLSAHKITCLADLLAQAYKFKWDATAEAFVAIEDVHEISRRLRKPWMQFLTQRFYGERATVESDHGKLISFLIGKAETTLTAEEKTLLRPYLDAKPETWQLENMAKRQNTLNELTSAFLSEHVLSSGTDVDNDPLFSFE